MARGSIGDFEQLVLLATLRLGDRAYGVPIVDEINERTGRTVSRAAVYIALRRLESKGMLRSRLAEPTPERGGRAKRFFTVEPLGMALLSGARGDLLSMWDGLQEALDNQ
jgi:PadR family transcriptional regulator PadR